MSESACMGATGGVQRYNVWVLSICLHGIPGQPLGIVVGDGGGGVDDSGGGVVFGL